MAVTIPDIYNAQRQKDEAAVAALVNFVKGQTARGDVLFVAAAVWNAQDERTWY